MWIDIANAASASAGIRLKANALFASAYSVTRCVELRNHPFRLARMPIGGVPMQCSRSQR